MPECFIIQPIHPAGLDLLRAGGVTPRPASAHDVATVLREIGTAEAVITRNAGFRRPEIEAGRHLRVICNHGVGMNAIDVDFATARGIPVVNTPTANGRSVAEHAIALMLGLARRVVEADAAVRGEDWRLRYEARMEQMQGKVLGLVGFGSIGRMTGAIARAGFGMELLVFSPQSDDAALAEAGARRATSLHALLAEADVVSLHRPLRADTRHCLDAAALACMKPTALLVNTARAELIDGAALAEALHAGRIAGAALDVFVREPPKAEDDPLLRAPRTLLAPHIAGVTEDAMRETALQCAAQVLDVLAGRQPPNLVRPEVWARRV
jgi:D-3-phosphoglycerate dehydrogenase